MIKFAHTAGTKIIYQKREIWTWRKIDKPGKWRFLFLLNAKGKRWVRWCWWRLRQKLSPEKKSWNTVKRAYMSSTPSPCRVIFFGSTFILIDDTELSGFFKPKERRGEWCSAVQQCPSFPGILFQPNWRTCLNQIADNFATEDVQIRECTKPDKLANRCWKLKV